MSYIDSRNSKGVMAHCWDEHTRFRLNWLYGPERAARIVRGEDGATEKDIEAWRNLGRGRST